MCNPTVTTLALRSDGPCHFSVRSYDGLCAAFSLAWSWRASLANMLRTLADKAEGQKSLTIVAFAPPQIVWGDVTDAATVGFNGATQYLNDLWRERVHGSGAVAPEPIAPLRSVEP